MTEIQAVDATLERGHLETLLARVAAGDRSAFESLYRASAPRLYAICLGVLSDRGEAEDVLQDVYVGVWHKAAQFDAARASAAAWLGTIARNRAIDRLRSAQLPLRTAPVELVEAIADPGPSPDRQAQAAGDRAQLDACMDQLDDRRRNLIRIAFFEGATYEELAARIGAPLGSVKSWIRRGLLQLRACLEGSAA